MICWRVHDVALYAPWSQHEQLEVVSVKAPWLSLKHTLIEIEIQPDSYIPHFESLRANIRNSRVTEVSGELFVQYLLMMTA